MKLVIEDQAGTRTQVPFSADELVVGRAAEGVSWRLPERNVSRRHARFTRSNGHVFVEDLGSLTGTRLNGERIAGRRRVRPGDLVEIGDFDLVVITEELAAAGPGEPPPLPTTTRPEPVLSPAELAQARAAAVPPAPAPDRPARPVGRLARLGLAALLGGLVLGVVLRRLLT
jgi:pSer/pThr/pTyr-binding forkhead associated (FHA) protein